MTQLIDINAMIYNNIYGMIYAVEELNKEKKLLSADYTAEKDLTASFSEVSQARLLKRLKRRL